MEGQPPPSQPPQPPPTGSVRAAPATKTGKRKRLSKACDACHKSKRRCDGTAPCSNCFFAEKECTYTSSSGRPVPAPRPARPHGLPLLPEQLHLQPTQLSPTHGSMRPYPPPSPAQLHAHHYQESEAGPSRKRSRPEYFVAGPPPILPPLPPPAHQRLPALNPHSTPMLQHAELFGNDAASSIVLEPALVRELVNLFFAHCHPARMIIHKPSFSSALALNQVPPYLLNAVCAHAARYSRQPRIRAAQPQRLAGAPFQRAALAIMFDPQGRLVVPADLAAVQALTLIQMVDFHQRASILGSSGTHYHALAIKIMKEHDLRVPDPFHTGRAAGTDSSPPPAPSDVVARAIERECLRRCGWLIYAVTLLGMIFIDTPTPSEQIDTSTTCLPLDETRFEFSELALTTSPEYLDEPPQTDYASEFGHFVRVVTIFHRAKSQLAAAAESVDPGSLRDVLERNERTLEAWANSLPQHLRFSEQSLGLQMSMFETSSNSGAWCFCMIHVLQSSCELALANARAMTGGERVTASHPAAKRLTCVVNALGTRASNSFLKGLAVFPLLPLYPLDHPLLIEWQAEVEQVWNVKVSDIAAAMSRMRVPSASPPGARRSASGSDLGAGSRGELSPPLSSPRSSDTHADPSASPHYQASGMTRLPSLRESGLLGTWDAPRLTPPPAGPEAVSPRQQAFYTTPPPKVEEIPVSIAHRPPPASAPRGLGWLLDEQRH